MFFALYQLLKSLRSRPTEVVCRPLPLVVFDHGARRSCLPTPATRTSPNRYQAYHLPASTMPHEGHMAPVQPHRPHQDPTPTATTTTSTTTTTSPYGHHQFHTGHRRSYHPHGKHHARRGTSGTGTCHPNGSYTPRHGGAGRQTAIGTIPRHPSTFQCPTIPGSTPCYMYLSTSPLGHFSGGMGCQTPISTIP